MIRSGGNFSKNSKIFVPLHSWELTLILVIGLGLFTENWILTVTAGTAHMAHLIQDILAYNVKILGYSFFTALSTPLNKGAFAHR